MKLLLAVVIGYILGSIPFSYISAWIFKGVDIRQAGNRNVGAMNVFGVAGRLPGIGALVGDILKGAAAVLVAGRLMALPEWASGLAGFAAIAGHNWSVFLRFSGGKGLATCIGVVSLLTPKEVLVLVVPTGVIYLLTRSLTFSVLISGIVLPFIVLFTKKLANSDATVAVIEALMALLVIIRGRETVTEAFKQRRDKISSGKSNA
jgi:glycerol-3-phosphate acyltransferase PlsY